MAAYANKYDGSADKRTKERALKHSGIISSNVRNVRNAVKKHNQCCLPCCLYLLHNQCRLNVSSILLSQPVPTDCNVYNSLTTSVVRSYRLFSFHNQCRQIVPSMPPSQSVSLAVSSIPPPQAVSPAVSSILPQQPL